MLPSHFLKFQNPSLMSCQRISCRIVKEEQGQYMMAFIHLDVGDIEEWTTNEGSKINFWNPLCTGKQREKLVSVLRSLLLTIPPIQS